VSRVVAVRRSGGLAGMVRAGEVDLDGVDDRAPELSALVAAVDLTVVTGTSTRADGFVYRFDLCGDVGSLPEQDLTPELRRVAELVLDQDR
jgi:hypothetical protein